MLCVYLPSNDGESRSQQLFLVPHAVLVCSSDCTVASIIHFLSFSSHQVMNSWAAMEVSRLAKQKTAALQLLDSQTLTLCVVKLLCPRQ